MKPTIIFTLSFLLSASIPLVFSKELVVDTDGKPLIGLGAGYYILEAHQGLLGGGVRPAVTGSQTFPVTVLQDYLEFVNGEPVKFNTGFGPGLAFTGEPLEISFANNTHDGVSSSKWVVVSDDFSRPWVGIGGAEDHPGKAVLNGEFNIQKTDLGYKLVFSPTSTTPPGLSFEIGIVNDENGRRLVRIEESEAAFHVVFVDATVAHNGVKPQV